MKLRSKNTEKWRNKIHEENPLMVFRNLWFVPWAWCKLCYRASHTDKYTEEEQYSFIRWVDLHANKGGNVKIDVHGSENIPAENGFMFSQTIRVCMMCWR